MAEWRTDPTSYSPQRAGADNIRMEGGYLNAGAQYNPYGSNLVQTLEMYRQGLVGYASIAGNPQYVGRLGVMDEVTYTNKFGETYTLTNVPVVQDDKGQKSRFQSESRVDIAADRDLTEKQMNTQGFLAEPPTFRSATPDEWKQTVAAGLGAQAAVLDPQAIDAQTIPTSPQNPLASEMWGVLTDDTPLAQQTGLMSSPALSTPGISLTPEVPTRSPELGMSLISPTFQDARVTSGYGARSAPTPGASTNHPGIDYAGAVGTPVDLAHGGVVTFAGVKGGYGNTVEILHGFTKDGQPITTRYGHLDSIADGLAPQQILNRADVIGTLGSTGRSTGPHLHQEVRIGDTPVKPTELQKFSEDLFDSKGVLASPTPRPGADEVVSAGAAPPNPFDSLPAPGSAALAGVPPDLMAKPAGLTRGLTAPTPSTAAVPPRDDQALPPVGYEAINPFTGKPSAAVAPLDDQSLPPVGYAPVDVPRPPDLPAPAGPLTPAAGTPLSPSPAPFAGAAPNVNRGVQALSPEEELEQLAAELAGPNAPNASPEYGTMPVGLPSDNIAQNPYGPGGIPNDVAGLPGPPGARPQSPLELAVQLAKAETGALAPKPNDNLSQVSAPFGSPDAITPTTAGPEKTLADMIARLGAAAPDLPNLGQSAAGILSSASKALADAFAAADAPAAPPAQAGGMPPQIAALELPALPAPGTTPVGVQSVPNPTVQTAAPLGYGPTLPSNYGAATPVAPPDEYATPTIAAPAPAAPTDALPTGLGGPQVAAGIQQGLQGLDAEIAAYTPAPAKPATDQWGAIAPPDEFIGPPDDGPVTPPSIAAVAPAIDAPLPSVPAPAATVAAAPASTPAATPAPNTAPAGIGPGLGSVEWSGLGNKTAAPVEAPPPEENPITKAVLDDVTAAPTAPVSLDTPATPPKVTEVPVKVTTAAPASAPVPGTAPVTPTVVSKPPPLDAPIVVGPPPTAPAPQAAPPSAPVQGPPMPAAAVDGVLPTGQWSWNTQGNPPGTESWVPSGYAFADTQAQIAATGGLWGGGSFFGGGSAGSSGGSSSSSHGGGSSDPWGGDFNDYNGTAGDPDGHG